MGISNLAALRRQVKADLTGTDGGAVVGLAFATLPPLSQASTIGVPPNPPTPVVPATGVAEVNANACAVNVSISGGTVTAIKVNGTATGLVAGNFVVPSGGSVEITYSAAPTWVWTNADGMVGFCEVLVGTTVRKLPHARR